MSDEANKLLSLNEIKIIDAKFLDRTFQARRSLQNLLQAYENDADGDVLVNLAIEAETRIIVCHWMLLKYYAGLLSFEIEEMRHGLGQRLFKWEADDLSGRMTRISTAHSDLGKNSLQRLNADNISKVFETFKLALSDLHEIAADLNSVKAKHGKLVQDHSVVSWLTIGSMLLSVAILSWLAWEIQIAPL